MLIHQKLADAISEQNLLGSDLGAEDIELPSRMPKGLDGARGFVKSVIHFQNQRNYHKHCPDDELNHAHDEIHHPGQALGRVKDANFLEEYHNSYKRWRTGVPGQ